MTNKVQVYKPEQHDVVVRKNAALLELRDNMFVEGIHFGEPFKDAGKPTLLKPGAETIMSRFELWPNYVERSSVERFDPQNPVFHYRYECQLVHRETGEIWGAGIGSCNSMEDKYGWRWVSEDNIPPHLDIVDLEQRSGVQSEYDFAIGNAETTGDYAKPQAYWDMWNEAIKNKTARRIKKTARTGRKLDAWEIGLVEYRIPNANVFTIVNTIDKMAQKRALVAAVLVATGASAYFTQDVEDFPDYTGEIIQVEWADSPPQETTPDKPQDRRMDTSASQRSQPKAGPKQTHTPKPATEEPAHVPKSDGVLRIKDVWGTTLDDLLETPVNKVPKKHYKDIFSAVNGQDGKPDIDTQAFMRETYGQGEDFGTLSRTLGTLLDDMLDWHHKSQEETE